MIDSTRTGPEGPTQDRTVMEIRFLLGFDPNVVAPQRAVGLVEAYMNSGLETTIVNDIYEDIGKIGISRFWVKPTPTQAEVDAFAIAALEESKRIQGDRPLKTWDEVKRELDSADAEEALTPKLLPKLILERYTSKFLGCTSKAETADVCEAVIDAAVQAERDRCLRLVVMAVVNRDGVDEQDGFVALHAAVSDGLPSGVDRRLVPSTFVQDDEGGALRQVESVESVDEIGDLKYYGEPPGDKS